MALLEKLGFSADTARKLNGRTDPGEMDILAKLEQEHDEVQELLDKLVKSEKAAERTKLLGQIKKSLIPHTKAEQKVVYDRVIALKDKDAKIDGEEGYIEHQIAERTLAQLGKITNRTSPEFSACAKVLKELVNHHIKEEESNLWRDVEDNFSEEDRQEMFREFEAAKKKVKVA